MNVIDHSFLYLTLALLIKEDPDLRVFAEG